MGGEQSTTSYKGHRSRQIVNDNVDYKNTRHANYAKEELYKLFTEDMLIHKSVLDEEVDKAEKLLADNIILRGEVDRLNSIIKEKGI